MGGRAPPRALVAPASRRHFALRKVPATAENRSTRPSAAAPLAVHGLSLSCEGYRTRVKPGVRPAAGVAAPPNALAIGEIPPQCRMPCTSEDLARATWPP